jgi:hypothetical protein
MQFTAHRKCNHARLSVHMPIRLHVITSENTSLRCWVSSIPTKLNVTFFSCSATALLRPRPPHCWSFEITLRHTTLDRTPLDEVSPPSQRPMRTHNIHKKQKSMLPLGFEPTIPASERPQTNALDSAATGISECNGCILRLKCDGTRWRTGEEMKGKQENGVGNQLASCDCKTQACTSSTNPAAWCAQLACQ